MAYLVSGTDLTSVANAIRTAGGTSAQLEFPSGFVTAIGNISGGGGGATNFVKGTFTPSESEKGTVKTISIPYTGSGYPVSVLIYPSGGYNDQMSIWSLVRNKTILMYVMAKSDASVAPDYSTSNVVKNQALIVSMYKNSASDATNLAASVSKGAIAFTSYNPNGTSNLSNARFASATSMKIFVADADYGFLAEQEYVYEIVYSS